MTLLAPTYYIGERAARRVLADCETLAWLQTPPPLSACERLERALGGPLAQRLVRALAGDHRMRARERVA